jgi:hypothetical protein
LLSPLDSAAEENNHDWAVPAAINSIAGAGILEYQLDDALAYLVSLPQQT